MATQQPTNRIRWFYVRDKDGKPVACIATKRENQSIAIAFSVCNPVDQWNKKIARDKAIGRVNSVSFLHHCFGEGDIKKNVMKTLAKGEPILDDEGLLVVSIPTRLKQAAKFWLSEGEQIKRGIKKSEMRMKSKD